MHRLLGRILLWSGTRGSSGPAEFLLAEKPFALILAVLRHGYEVIPCEKKTEKEMPRADSNEFEMKPFDVPASFVHAGSEKPDVLRKRFKSD